MTVRLRQIGAFVGLLLALISQPALAATISIVSMQYSAAHPVPHLSYEGETADGDVALLQEIYDRFVKCREACIGPEGGATAVLTLNGPGGSYFEGLALADFLREHHIATVVERGMSCYSACAFAFLGGSGYSPQQGVGTYIDRMVEPGSIVGFHSPYADEESFTNALKERGAMAAQGDTRDALALMVKELVKWNVDPEVLFYMVGKGPDESYDLVAADDLYLARVSLPPTPTSAWIRDLPEAVKNACERLLAISERGDPLDMRDRFLSDWTEAIGHTKEGTISGYKLGDAPLEIGNCAITDASRATDGDYDISLYFSPGIDGTNAPALSLFNRQHGWSTAGTGSNPLKRIFQKGALNSFFLPQGVAIDDLDLPGEEAIDANRFKMVLSPLMATLPDGFAFDSGTESTRISRKGNVIVFERVGPALLFDSAAALPGLGRSFTNSAGNETSFVREGTYDESGTSFAWFGLKNGEHSTVIEAQVLRDDGGPADADDLATLHELVCGTRFEDVQLSCE